MSQSIGVEVAAISGSKQGFSRRARAMFPSGIVVLLKHDFAVPAGAVVRPLRHNKMIGSLAYSAYLLKPILKSDVYNSTPII